MIFRTSAQTAPGDAEFSCSTALPATFCALLLDTLPASGEHAVNLSADKHSIQGQTIDLISHDEHGG
jgi:hypothetical protein